MPARVATATVVNLEEGFALQMGKNEEAIDAFLSEVADRVALHAQGTGAFEDKTGNLRTSIKKKKSKYIRGGYIVNATGKMADGQKGYHAALVEFGHVAVPAGKLPGGRVPAYPFMRKALDKGSVYAAAKISGMNK